MIRYELKKLLVGRTGWLLILVLLIAELGSMLLFTKPYDSVLETNRTVYESYLAEVEGPLTEEKRSFLETEMERLNSVHEELEQLKQDYYSGRVTDEVYRETFDLLSAEDAKYTGFSKLYSQYIFVRESVDRSFLYTGGWEVLLADQAPDYLFLLVLIVLLTPIFCEEYSCRMHEILLTQKRSAKYQVAAKVSVAMSLALALTVLFQLADLVYCAARFGLSNGSFSLQSLHSFGTTAKQMTLWQAFCLQLALKAAGYLYAAIVILFLAVVLKKFALTLMASIAILLLPPLTTGGADSFLSVPGPWALTVGSIYLHGGENELSWVQLGILLVISGIFVLLMLYGICRRNANWQLKRKSFRKIACLLCVLPMLLAGCGENKPAVVYNRSQANHYETDVYSITAGFEGATIPEKTTGNCYTFPLSPLEGEIVTCGNTIYGEGDTVWYLRTTTHHPSAGWDTIHTDCDLVKLNLTTMEETVVYQWNEDWDWFFGLLDRSSPAPASFSVELLFIHKRQLYYVDTSQSTLNRMHVITGEHEVILNEMYSQDVAYDGTNLYYLDSYNRLVIHDLTTSDKRAIEEVVAKDFLLAQDGIYFRNRRDNSKTYYWDDIEGNTFEEKG